MGKLDGRVAIVTGASRGIGAEVARLFAAAGAKVVCAARTLNEGDHRLLSGSLSGTVAKIRAAGGEALALAADVSDEADCRKLSRELGWRPAIDPDQGLIETGRWFRSANARQRNG